MDKHPASPNRNCEPRQTVPGGHRSACMPVQFGGFSTDEVAMTANAPHLGLRPSRGLRTTLVGAWALLGCGFVYNALRLVSGDGSWNLTHALGMTLLGAILLVTTYAAARSVGALVWYDASTNTVRQRVAFVETSRRLHRPTTVEFIFRRSFIYPSGIWRVEVRSAGEPVMVLSTPWVGNVEDVARMLRPAFHRNLDLPHDEFSRNALIDPAVLAEGSLRIDPGAFADPEAA